MAWDRTPMYAYGGLAKVLQIHHVCLLDFNLIGRMDLLGIGIFILIRTFSDIYQKSTIHL